ncbi:MAG: hypothetical protein ACTHJ2_05605 [Candidatus Nitrosocosmicus sp.]
MHILPRRSLDNVNDKNDSNQKKRCAIIEADLTKLQLNDSERNSIGKEIVKIAKKNSINDVNVQYAFISDNKRKVIIFASYDNEGNFKTFYSNLKSKVNLNNKDIFLLIEGVNVLQR